MSPRATLLPDGGRLVVDAVTGVLSVLLAALLLATVLAPPAGEMAGYLPLVTLYLVPAQVVQAVLGQFVLVRLGSAVGRTLAMLGIWAVVLGALAFLLPLLAPDGLGSGFLLVLPEAALLAVTRGGVVLVLDLDRRLPLPSEVAPGAQKRAGAAPLG